MQVLELAGRPFEDQVSKSGHAQVCTTLWQKEGTLALSAPARCPWEVSLASLRLDNRTGPSQSPLPQGPACGLLRPPAQALGVLRGQSGCSHLILAVLANHLQSALRDQWRLQHNFSEDPAREEE